MGGGCARCERCHSAFVLQDVVLVGGGAKSAAVRALAPQMLDAAVELPEPGEYVALGAAKQAARVLGA